jgi:hypothetical protein
MLQTCSAEGYTSLNPRQAAICELEHLEELIGRAFNEVQLVVCTLHQSWGK